jgi:hypothetical protein
MSLMGVRAMNVLKTVKSLITKGDMHGAII